MSTSQASEWSLSAVKEVVQESDHSKRTIAEAIGMPYSTLTRKLAGRSEFTLEDLFLLAEALGVPPSRFVPPGSDDARECVGAADVAFDDCGG